MDGFGAKLFGLKAQDMYFRPERDKSSTTIWSRRTLINRLTHTPLVSGMCLGCFWSNIEAVMGCPRAQNDKKTRFLEHFRHLANPNHLSAGSPPPV